MTAAATLPGGYCYEGICYHEAVLRPLTGTDEMFLLEESPSLPAVQRITALLCRCLRTLGPLRRVTAEAVRSLTVGDRDALVLHLRRLTFGNRMDTILSCPYCGERLDLELSIDELLLPRIPNRQEWYEEKLETDDGSPFRVRFRLPTGADQEAVEELAAADAAAAEAFLLKRCVVEVQDDGAAKPFEAWPDIVRREIPSRMAKLDPQAELEFRLHCPTCEEAFSSLLDPSTFLLEELAARSRNLYREIHWLALHYHWSQRELLRLTPAKRWLYLQLLEESSAGGRVP